ncbi:aminotransferase class I/II-fold pyridoxal phosphate-dependent enzyme [Glaciihabitans arcticus]|uniref:Aminotransferase class I/II-fold pyridoxal phosphate-dependent enzyme n=1 Tax=Glaciihabitans arcticus TaxID=2668039 RepID=A0A4V2JEU6_9MICO|nr:aminotransferase class I/II-fold pyridoxal phosphate-dependent enzyme [Glaciihabitans arcticus]TBN56979.1 aminotransferase class I/II-fold pyridoxal phosphate-dependent enzyme [Glaciihabitans arcticus]
MPMLAPHISSVPGSGIRRVYEIAAGLEGVNFLVVGEPDVPVAAHIAEAAKRAWDADETNYTANAGIPPLRRAIVDKLARENDIHVDESQVTVTVGATQGLHQAMALTLGPGDEVLVPDPGYTTFTMNAHMLSAVAVPYELRPERDFQPDLEQLESLITERTRVLIVNSPSNPLGVIFDAEMLQRLLDFAKKHDLWVISDEVYEYFTWGEKHSSMASFDEDNRVLSVFSFSKTYAMTGVRVGYLVTPRSFEATMRTVQEATVSCVATPDQYAALAAITGDHGHVADAKAHYRSNLAAATELLASRGIPYLTPRGTFYLWIDLSHATGGNVAAWAERFLREQLVAVAPGSAFGRSGEGWIRVCLAAPQADILDGLGKLPAPTPGEAS